ncbi:MAG: hypothetical protein ABIR29_06165 [Chthoniobacterales bacterium]
MDKFSFFFGFYGLILGLAVAELLNGLGALVRAGELRRLGWQTGLLGFFVLMVVCATWIDAWDSLRDTTLDFAGLWAPLLIAIFYYLAAVVTFPKNPAEWASLDNYFIKRKRFVLSLMLGAEFLVNYSYRGVLLEVYRNHPAKFWEWTVPYNLAIKVGFLGLIFVKGRIANIVGLLVMGLLFVIPYWHHG